MNPLLIAAFLIQAHATSGYSPMVPTGTPVDSIDWDRDPIVEYRYCGEENEFFRIDCGVTTRSGQELVIFDGQIARAYFHEGTRWIRGTPFGDLMAGQELRVSVEILDRFCEGNQLEVVEARLTVIAWSCGNHRSDETISLTFDASYRAATIEERFPAI